MIRQIDKAGENLIIELEGIRFSAYKDGKGYNTIGIGHLITKDEPYLNTAMITRPQVMDLFYKDISIREYWIVTNCKWTPEITQGEFNALCSFLFQYNIDKYPDTKAAIISGNRENIIKQLRLFKSVNPADRDLKLVDRREKEIKMFKSNRDKSLI